MRTGGRVGKRSARRAQEIDAHLKALNIQKVRRALARRGGHVVPCAWWPRALCGRTYQTAAWALQMNVASGIEFAERALSLLSGPAGVHLLPLMVQSARAA